MNICLFNYSILSPMKKLLISMFFVLLASTAFAQDGIYRYCELVGSRNVLGTRFNVNIILGREGKLAKVRENLVDKDGKLMKFYSMIDGMNFMSKQGWEFVQAYIVISGGDNEYHWLLKQKVETVKEEEIKVEKEEKIEEDN